MSKRIFTPEMGITNVSKVAGSKLQEFVWKVSAFGKRGQETEARNQGLFGRTIGMSF